jgi:hypothetical protein
MKRRDRELVTEGLLLLLGVAGNFEGDECRTFSIPIKIMLTPIFFMNGISCSVTVPGYIYILKDTI